MKNILLFWLLAFCGTLLYASDYQVNVATELNVRDAASSTGVILGKLPNGSILHDVTLVADGQWAEISFNGGTGYVKSDYLKPYQAEQVVGRKNADDAHFLSLKTCFIVILILAALSFCVGTAYPMGEMAGARCLFYIAMCGMIIGTFLLYDFGDVVNPRWTGGWLNGYFWAFINSLLLALMVIQTYRLYVETAFGFARQHLDEAEVYSKVNIHFFVWIAPLGAICVLVSLLLCAAFPPILLICLIPVILLIRKIVQNVRALKPHYFLAFWIMVLGFIATFTIGILVYTAFKMLVLGILACIMAFGAIKALPSVLGAAVNDALKSSPEPAQDSYDTPTAESTSGSFQEGIFGNYIKDGDGKEHRITGAEHRSFDDVVKTEDGERWTVDRHGNATKN